jgi:predicted anti-sigma-YlaC factor YlaD
LSALAALVVAAPALQGCSVRRMAIRTVARAISSGTDVYATDDDPELVGAALPFALKTVEGLLAQDPTNRDLLLAADRGFTQYAYAFVQLPADQLGDDDFERSQAMRARAVKLYLRARDYGLRGLALAHTGIDDRLRTDPVGAAAELSRDDLPLAFWTAAAWGSAISAGKDHAELLADLPAVRALVERGLALDESWGAGALHGVMVQLETALPAGLGSSPEKAKEHFERAEALSHGNDAMLYVGYAQAVAMPAQDRAAWEGLLQKAQAVNVDVDPSLRLSNTLAQRRAAWLLAHADDFFLGDAPAGEEPAPEAPVPGEAEPAPTPPGGTAP